MEEIRIYRDVKKLVFPFIALVGLFIAIIAATELDIVFRVVYIIFFGLVFIVAAYQVFDRRPILIINETGVTRRFIAGGTLHADWARVESVRLDNNSKWLTFYVSNEKELVQHWSKFKKFWMGYFDSTDEDWDEWTAFNFLLEDLKCDKQFIHSVVEKCMKKIKSKEEK